MAAMHLPYSPPAPFEDTPGDETYRSEGLGPEQIRERIERGDVNQIRDPTSRSIGAILQNNLLTRFNGILGVLLVTILIVGPLRDALFGISMIVNSLIGILQELRAKSVLDRLVLGVAPLARVIRSGASHTIRFQEIVRDDVLELLPGDQIAVDGPLLESQGLEVDESLLSGESRPVPKEVGDEVLSESLVVAGRGRMRASRIGEESYGRRLAAEARRFELARSELRAGIDTLLKWITWLLIPVGIILVLRELRRDEAGWEDAIRGSVAALEGMVPQGLVVLANLVMAIAIVRMGRHRVLIRELAAVETLARVDVLCLDKTGTLTTGEIRLGRIVPARSGDDAAPGFTTAAIRSALALLTHGVPDTDPTLRAISECCPAPSDPGWEVTGRVPFSWARRLSAVTTRVHGTWVLGAPEALLKEGPGTADGCRQAEELAASGERVLALGWSPSPLPAGTGLPADFRLGALVTLWETPRPGARETLRYFESQGVQIKVISGDHPRTVQALAVELGIPGADSRAGTWEGADDLAGQVERAERSVVFGRVSPEQKKEIVEALRRGGHVVAMVGDGLNDIPALKRADLGIAVRTAAPATRAVAKAVALDGFLGLPKLVAEGRQVIANVERTANLFLSKTCYVLLMAIGVMIAGIAFPLLPRQLTLLGSLSIGIPAFFVSLAPSSAPVRPGFIRRVVSFAVPAGLVAAAAALCAFGVTRHFLQPGNLSAARTASALTLTEAGVLLLFLLPSAHPRLITLLQAGTNVLLGLSVAVPPVREFLALELPSPSEWLLVLGLSALALLAYLSLRPRQGIASAR